MTYYAVRRFIRKFDNYASQKKKEYTPRLYGAQFDHIKSVIENSYSRDSSTTCKEIANTLRMQNIHISASQIQRYRCNIGFKRTTTKYCHTIREQNKVARVVFAQDMIARNESFYDCIFTDECTVQRYARLVQDNAPPHISAFTRQKLQDWNVEVLKWPAESPDLNPIELVWGNMKTFIRRRKVRTLPELKSTILEYWENLTPEICEKYINGVKKRLRRVVKRGGGNIIEGRETSSDFEDYAAEENEEV
ncbi:hypothetical protein ANCCEY_15169 [Ancylostoma ceylanicum]|uniref:Tc1-like transposase DDE domain-containing protein n=1 Tax=Ancylostoma ceylanicum TaxID=53326 RepID=A0A0D6LDM2_9BILA|nr:hypothetical protein ANCCEY_15169 [Ancylostoma ceylanicum]